MSIADHLPLRLRWYGGRGLARWRDGMMTLCAPPELGIEYEELDYAPGVCALIRRHISDAIDDMRPHEFDACARFLEALGDE